MHCAHNTLKHSYPRTNTSYTFHASTPTLTHKHTQLHPEADNISSDDELESMGKMMGYRPLFQGSAQLPDYFSESLDFPVVEKESFMGTLMEALRC